MKDIKYKVLQKMIDDELYRSDLSTLLAYDSHAKKYLFRSINSNYFLQNDNDEDIKLLTTSEAEEIWSTFPQKHVKDKTAAFPQKYGGIGIDTYTNLYDDN